MRRTLLVLILLISACKGAGGGSAASGGSVPNPSIDAPGNGNQPANPTPTPTILVDHSYRNNAPYGTVPTEEECKHMVYWDSSSTEEWYFGEWYAGIGTTQAQADAFNATHFLRFESGAVVWRDKVGGIWQNHAINNQWFNLGPDCDIHILSTLQGIDAVLWKGNVILP